MCRLGSLLIVSLGVLSGCASSDVLVPHAVDLVAAPQNIPEEGRLDVGVRVFDPGVPEGQIDKEALEELIETGIFVHIRRTESVYMAVQLRDTLRRSGYWGTVWVTPKASTAADINVIASILHSDGDIVRVDVEAVDATGRTWIDKPYELEAPAAVYNRQRYPDLDPYQDLFNSIANDLAAKRAELSAAQAREIRTVASLRYARDLSPRSFDGYVVAKDDGVYEAVRLPAVDDPMFGRTQRVRQRERLLFDTLNWHYDGFASEAEKSYGSWREAAREDAIAVRELARSARWRKALGIAATVASIASVAGGGGGGDYGSFSSRLVRDSMMFLGAGMLEMSAAHTQGKRLHMAALEELSQSFDDEAAPLVVEIAGVQRRLAGTAAVQYTEWRKLLHEIFLEERGLVSDNLSSGNIGSEKIEIYPAPVEVRASMGSTAH